MNQPILPLFGETDKLIIKSEGCIYTDNRHKQYIDFESGVWCANLGHNNKRLSEHIQTQLEESIHHGYYFNNRHCINLAEQLNHLCGFENGQSFFLCSGSEAINLSITIAQHLTERKKLLSISNSFLSAYGFGQISETNTHKTYINYNNTDAIEHIDFTDIAALVLETGGASVDVVKFPDKVFIERLVRKCSANNCVIIIDEVTTGMGRTGKWFGFQHYNVQPDMVVTGKALGNGYPVSGITANEKIAKLLNQKPLRYGQSHHNDPLGSSIGLKVIELLEEGDLINRSKEIGTYFLSILKDLQCKNSNKVEEVRGRGLMLAIEFKKHVNGDKVFQELLNKGFVVGYKENKIRFMPPLIIEKTHIENMVEALDKAL